MTETDAVPPVPPADAPDGSSDVSEERAAYTERLGDGSATGHATKDPDRETDTASGGDPEDGAGDPRDGDAGDGDSGDRRDDAEENTE
ncbi:hypothetical protein BJ978_000739 [Agromyces terreus]|uniref:Uncharacterized protein n=1 Tax=Agromyces terreus TaxID=424795 RepID=A0A9X2GZ70_9MICO|nr:hypothetical protein [Agromyces terreus]MCP2370063.1 hypothetical protein [Agromyces terreus]